MCMQGEQPEDDWHMCGNELSLLAAGAEVQIRDLTASSIRGETGDCVLMLSASAIILGQVRQGSGPDREEVKIHLHRENRFWSSPYPFYPNQAIPSG